MKLYTAHFSYPGPDRIDVTRGSGKNGKWVVFAPSWDLLEDTHFRVKHDKDITTEKALTIWNRYVERFTDEMRGSYRRNRDLWQEMLEKPRVVLCCYCTDVRQCHRGLLSGIFGKLGATPMGEINKGDELWPTKPT
jgi:uncharacterized protein YeaO (DUF488 family)